MGSANQRRPLRALTRRGSALRPYFWRAHLDCPQSTYASTFFATAIHVWSHAVPLRFGPSAGEGNGHTGVAAGKREAEICVHVVTASPPACVASRSAYACGWGTGLRGLRDRRAGVAGGRPARAVRVSRELHGTHRRWSPSGRRIRRARARARLTRAGSAHPRAVTFTGEADGRGPAAAGAQPARATRPDPPSSWHTRRPRHTRRGLTPWRI